MNKILIYTILGLFVSVSLVYAATSDSFTFSNYIRFGYDDNLYQDETNEIESSYISDIFNFTGKMLFSNRSEILLYWQPEFQYRFDAKEKELFLQDLYVSYLNSINQSSEIQITDRYRYSELDTNQSGNEASKEYAENVLKGSYRNQLNEKNGIILSAGLTSRRNDNDSSEYNKNDLVITMEIHRIINR